MKAILLAAGRGSRMGSLTENQPKCMVQLSGKSLVEWQLQALHHAGIKDVGIVTGYRDDMFAQIGTRRFHNSRWAETNMVMSLMCADEWLSRDTCIVSYSDIIYPASYVSMLMNAAGGIVITYDKDWLSLWSRRFENPLADAETFDVDDDGRVTDIGHKTELISAIRGQYMGLLKFTPIGWKWVIDYLSTLAPDARDRLDMTSLLQRLIKQGRVINTVPVRGGWGEVDNEQDLHLYHTMISEGTLTL